MQNDPLAAAVLEVRDVVGGYGDLQILKGASLRIAPAEIVAIIGPNGSGKSTLLKAVFGLLSIDRGSIVHGGADITRNTPEKNVLRGIGFVPQSDNIFAGLTIDENLEIGCYQKPAIFDEAAARVYDMFPTLAERRNEMAGMLSGGQRQMLAIGRAMMMSPSLLLLDEPSAGLSPIMTDYVFERIRELPGKGVSILLVEQNVKAAFAICARAYVFAAGRDRLCGSSAELENDAEIRQLYLGG